MRSGCSPIRIVGRHTHPPKIFLARRRRRSFATTAAQPDIYDVAIVGGGPAGLGLAAALRAHQSTRRLKVALIESQDLSPSKQSQGDAPLTQFSNRCSSLTPSSIEFLKEIGAHPHLNHARLQPYTHMSVWDGVTGQAIHFDWATASGPPLFPQQPPPPSASNRTIATMAENANLTSALLSTLSTETTSTSVELPPATLLPFTSVSSITLGGPTPTLDLSSWPILTLSSGTQLAARLLVGADGPNSSVRTFAGIASHGWDYERHGVVATLKLAPHTATAEGRTAYQRFLPSGPVALLPLSGDYASLVWSTTPAHAALLKSLSPGDFIAAVNAAFRLSHVDIEYMSTMPSGHIDELTWRERHTPFDASLVPPLITDVQAGSVASFPLRMRHAEAYTGERVALVGDAAHTVHPLAGQGLNLGLGDVRSLAGVLAGVVERGGDVGDQIGLEGYAAERYARNHVMLGVCDKLHKVYSWSSGPVVWGRSVGLGAVEGWGGLKGLVMGAAG